VTRVAIVCALALAAFACVAAALEARPAASYDYGDAPDGAPAGYGAAPSVVGRFPSKAASGGPRHTGGGPRIGLGWTSETSSRQVDRDRDDGASVVLRSCTTSTLLVPLDLSRVPPGVPVYVNAWFDWNQDGDWTDGASGTCGPEWGVQNHRLATSRLGSGPVLLELRFRAGRVPDQLWWRLQVHTGAPAPHQGGGGQATPTPGETEDTLFSRSHAVAAERVGLTCAPRAGALLHGKSHQLTAWLGGSLGRSISIARAQATLLGDRDGVVLGAPAVLRAPPNTVAVALRSTKAHDRPQVAQQVRVQFDVTAAVEGSLRDFRTTCAVTIWHSARIFPPPAGQPQKRPAVTVPGVGAAVDPIRPTPEGARCRATFVSSQPRSYGVRFRCDGVDVKSVSVSAGSRAEKIRKFAPNRGSTCETLLGGTAGRCIYTRKTKGLVLGFGFTTDTPISSNRINILAGGHSPGGTGTTIVLLQDWFVFPDGTLECRQQVPRAPTCAVV